MKEIYVCPSTLAEGYDTYSPTARKALFDGKVISHVIHEPSPSEEDAGFQESIRHIGRISLSGVQSKFAMVIDTEAPHLRYAREKEQGTYILKPRPNGYHILNKDFCAANEHLTMQIASQVYGIETAANALCFFRNHEAAYITRRFDIHSSGKYQQEDFAALMGYTKAHGGSDYKYCNASYEECAEIIRKYVKAASIDIARFYRLVLFNFISLNDDAHLKNFSLINKDGEYRLSPAYDLINTSLHLVQPRIFALDKGLFREGMKLTDTHQIGRGDFEEFGRRIGLPHKVVKRELDTLGAEKPLVRNLIERSFLSDSLKRQYWLSMDFRRKMLSF